MMCMAREVIKHLKCIISISDYTKDAWMVATKPRPNSFPTDPGKTPSKGSVTGPYLGPLLESIARLICKAGVSEHMKPFNTTSAKLVHPRDNAKNRDKPWRSIRHTMQCLWSLLCRTDWMIIQEKIVWAPMKHTANGTSYAILSTQIHHWECICDTTWTQLVRTRGS